MSFILDALKKSEAERQRNHGPGLAEVTYGPRRGSPPWWLIGLVVLLLVIVALLILVLFRVERAPGTAVAVQQPSAVSTAPPVAPTAAVAAPAAAPYSEPAPAAAGSTRSLAEEAGIENPEEDALQSGADPSLNLGAAAAVPEREPIVRSTVPGRLPPQSGYSSESLPSINELTGSVAQGLPPMHLDIHVYALKPAERFVFINMHKYVEGEATPEGLLIERITPDGVILNQRGLRFILPRQ